MYYLNVFSDTPRMAYRQCQLLLDFRIFPVDPQYTASHSRDVSREIDIAA